MNTDKAQPVNAHPNHSNKALPLAGLRVIELTSIYSGPLAGLLLAQQDQAAKPDPARSFFAGAPVVRVQITLDDKARQSLKEKPREYARATLQLDGDKATRDIATDSGLRDLLVPLDERERIRQQRAAVQQAQQQREMLMEAAKSPEIVKQVTGALGGAQEAAA